MQRRSLLLTAIVGGLFVSSNASAIIVFQDDFEAQPDADTASAFEGGTTNDPSNGDADPSAPTVGTWGPINENNPWKVQVSTATNSFAPGPSGTGKYLLVERGHSGGVGTTPTDARGAFASPATATDQLSFDFQIALSEGDQRVFLRGTDGTPFVSTGDTFKPVTVDFTLGGNVNVNGTVSPGVFTPAGGYETVHMDLDMATQKVTVSINGVSTANMTNRSFSEAVSTVNQFGLFVIDDQGVAGYDNISASVVPEPATGLLAIGVPALLALGRRRIRRSV